MSCSLDNWVACVSNSRLQISQQSEWHVQSFMTYFAQESQLSACRIVATCPISLLKHTYLCVGDLYQTFEYAHSVYYSRNRRSICAKVLEVNLQD